MSAARAGNFTLSTGVDYSTGNYGLSQSTDITYVPLTGRYETQNWITKLTVPYIRVTGPSAVLPQVGRVGSGAGPIRTEAGLGDVVFSLTRNVYSSRRYLADLTGTVKFGTADAS
ncbi:MAG TPA: hypothetical protein VE197_06565, partial [Mycobacterium sp.]|nr:hypothetical protein [Mycobacterium sp.]